MNRTRSSSASPIAALLWIALAAVGPMAGRAEEPSPLPGAPHFATFSICAIDPETGEAGVAVTTRVPFVGRAVPWVRAGVGAVATQSWTVVEYGLQGLDLLEQGVPPEEALDRLLADDAGREQRQLGLVDMQGRSAAFTGAENGEWAGSRQGEGYTVQGNILVGPEVVEAVADHFESTAGTGKPLAERLILALEAGQGNGGDRRWGYFQSAALRIADPRDPGRGGDHISLAIDVGEHPTPVAEMKRIYFATGRRLGYRDFSEVRGPDVVELKRLLWELGFWGRELEEFPEGPEWDVDRELMRSDPEAFLKEVEKFRELQSAYDESWGVYDREAIEAVDAFREEHQLDFVGNPAGLVDERLVEALKAEAGARRRAAAPGP